MHQITFTGHLNNYDTYNHGQRLNIAWRGLEATHLKDLPNGNNKQTTSDPHHQAYVESIKYIEIGWVPCSASGKQIVS